LCPFFLFTPPFVSFVRKSLVKKKADAVFTVSAACRVIENYLAFDHAVSDTLVAGARFRPMRLIVSVVNRMSRAV